MKNEVDDVKKSNEILVSRVGLKGALVFSHSVTSPWTISSTWSY